MAYIPEDILFTIKETADIRQVVQEFVPLKKKGKNWVGLCPFHPDSSPSFTVNEDKQIFYCFGCGEGGNVFKFLMKIQGLSFVEAVKVLAKRYGISIPERPLSVAQQRQKETRERLLEINKAAFDHFRSNLLASEEGIDARDYLDARGLSQETIDVFGIGWAKDSWDDLVDFLSSSGFDLELAEKVGLVIRRKGATGYYDRFRGRIVFPIHDHRGDIVAFGGRVIDAPGQEELPKYINSPESPLYHKGKVLFGLFHNKSSIRKAGLGMVVEGYMDVISLWQFGVRHVIGTLGTALTEDHVKRMKGIVKEWVLLFDSDEAGLKAAKRALPICYRFDLRPKVLLLPEGDDPDSFIRREGMEGLLGLAENAPGGIDFLLDRGLSLYGTTTEGKLKVVDDILEVLSQVSDPVRKSLFIGQVAQRLGIREESLWQRISSEQKRAHIVQLGKDREDADDKKKLKVVPRITNRADEKVLGFLLSYPQYMDMFRELGLEFWLSDENLLELWQAMENLYSMNGRLDLMTLCQRLEHVQHLKTIAMRLASRFPPCEDLDLMASELMVYCEKKKKKALRAQLIEQLRQEQEDDGVKILEYIKSLR